MDKPFFHSYRRAPVPPLPQTLTALPQDESLFAFTGVKTPVVTGRQRVLSTKSSSTGLPLRASSPAAAMGPEGRQLGPQKVLPDLLVQPGLEFVPQAQKRTKAGTGASRSVRVTRVERLPCLGQSPLHVWEGLAQALSILAGLPPPKVMKGCRGRPRTRTRLRRGTVVGLTRLSCAGTVRGPR